jgi:hypothetical protein
LWICELLAASLLLTGALTARAATEEEFPTLPETSVTPLTDDYVAVSPPTHWGFQFDATLAAFGGDPISSGGVDYKVRGFDFGFDYLLPFSETYGKFSIGPVVGLYSVDGEANFTNGAFGLWKIGAQVRYQFKYFNRQWVVPVVGFMLEQLRYSLTYETTANSLLLSGYTAGLWVFLNPFEPSAATAMANDSGITRTYLLAEIRGLGGVNDDFDIGGTSLFFGLRFEH